MYILYLQVVECNNTNTQMTDAHVDHQQMSMLAVHICEQLGGRWPWTVCVTKALLKQHDTAVLAVLRKYVGTNISAWDDFSVFESIIMELTEHISPCPIHANKLQTWCTEQTKTYATVQTSHRMPSCVCPALHRGIRNV